MWISQHKELGIVKVGSKNVIEFKLAEPVPEDFVIKGMKASCGCSKPTKIDNGVSISFTAQPVPRQMIIKGQYTTVKKITVDTENHGKFDLTFRATIRN